MGDTPTALAPFLQVILYGVMAIGWAYAAMWAAALFCLLGDTYPITAHRKGEGPLLPVWAARTAAAALPIASGLLYRDLIVLVLSLLWSGLILSRTKRKLP